MIQFSRRMLLCFLNIFHSIYEIRDHVLSSQCPRRRITRRPLCQLAQLLLLLDQLVVVVATFERLQAVLPQSLKHGRTSAVGTLWQRGAGK